MVKPPLILVVEDEALIRMMAVEILESEGFRTLEASTADEAIQILETQPDVRLVFTDIHMPGSMDGLRLVSTVSNRWPPVKIIVASGRFRPKVGELPVGAIFLQKPYSPTEVCSHMRRLTN